MDYLRCAVCLTLMLMTSRGQESNGKNVLMIIVDDLRPELGPFLDTDDSLYPEILTPNINALADNSIVFKQAFSQYAVCGPSRNSLMTGRRPDTTRVYTNGGFWREDGGNFSSIPQYFKQYGYKTYASGKIYHGYSDDDTYSWSEPNYAPTNGGFWRLDDTSWNIAEPDMVEEVPLPCMQIRDFVISKLRQAANQNETFFIAAGIQKPHLPFTVPREFYELYPEEEMYLPANPSVPLNYPEVAWSNWGDLANYADIEEYDNSFNQSLPDNKTLELRRGYYASVSYADSLIGDLLDELQRLGLTADTAVLFVSDHGWHLGEHNEWAKQSNLFLDTHIPMMLKIPGSTTRGLVSNAFVENVDIFPTLADVAGLPVPDLCPDDSTEIGVCTEGVSLLPLVEDPEPEEWKSAVFSQFQRGNFNSMGYSILTSEFHYTKWVGYNRTSGVIDWDVVIGEELYDSINDPNELESLAADPQYEEVKSEMEVRLEAGWRAALPQSVKHNQQLKN